MEKTSKVELDLDVGDIILTGRYKNKRQVVKTLGTDDLGQPTVNGMKLLALRLEKKMPKNRQSKETQMNKQAFAEGYMHKQAVSPGLIRRGIQAAKPAARAVGGYLKDPLGRQAGRDAVARYQQGMDAAKELKRVQAPVRALQGAQQHQRHTSSLHDKAVASQKAYNARELERLQQLLAKHRKFMNTPQSSPMLEDSKQNLGRLALKQLERAIDDIQRAPLSPRTQKPLTEANEALAKAKANAMQNYNVGRAAKLSKTDADTMGEVNDLFRKKDIHQNVSKGLGGTAAAGAGAAGVKKYKEQQTAPPATAAPPKLSDHIRRTLSNVR